MLIFLDDEQAYRRWITHHRQGFVLDGRRKPQLIPLVLHRATCVQVKTSGQRRSHLTTAPHFKAYAEHLIELEDWSQEQTSQPATACPICRPREVETHASETHLTKLGRDILDYVTEAATIHIEHAFPPYRLTVGDIAACFAKTPGQLKAVLKQLESDGFIECVGQHRDVTRNLVFPTISGMRKLHIGLDEPDAMLADELAKLKEQ